MKLNKILLVYFFIFLQVSIFAQKKKKLQKIPKNIELISSKFSFTPFYVNEYSYFQIKSRKYKHDGTIKYKPNIIGSVGAKLTIKNFTLAYAQALPRPIDYGKTKALNLIFNYQRRVFGLQLFWIQYSGLYIDTLDRYRIYNEYKKTERDNAIILRPDIKLNTIGFQTNIITNKNFSINAAFEQTERQKKNAGSFLISMGFNYMGVKNNKEESLILPSLNKYYPLTSEIYNLGAVSFKIAPGFGYSFIIKRYFSVSAILSAGANVQFKWYSLTNSNFKKYRPWLTFNYGVKTAIGYNGENITANLIYSRNQDIIGFNRIYLDNEYNSKTNFKFFREFLKISVGFRIN